MNDHMPTAERAVILSAGQGSRLLPLTEDLPKCLLDLSGRSMLDWQLRGLAEAGVPEAVVVTGFRADQVEAALQHIAPPGHARCAPCSTRSTRSPTTWRAAGWRAASWTAPR